MPKRHWRGTMSDYDVMIIGAGPAGLSCASYAARSGMRTLVLEAGFPGGQVLSLDKVENYPSIKPMEGFALASAFQAQAESFGARIELEGAMSLKKEDGLFCAGDFKAPICVLATGCSRRKLGCKGEEQYTGRGVSYCATCDGPFFKGKKMLVIGGGDSAVQEAIYLSGLTGDLTICHRRATFRAQAALARSLENHHVKTRMNSSVLEIIGDGKKVTAVKFDDLSEESFDAVFIFVGLVPNNDLAKAMGCKLDDIGFVMTDAAMRTSVDGLFAIGDVRNTLFRQIVTASSDGAIAAHFAKQELDSLEGRSYI